MTTSDAVLLQQIYETGSYELETIDKYIRMPHRLLISSLERLKNNGYIRVKNLYGATQLYVSKKGELFIQSLWPDALVSL